MNPWKIDRAMVIAHDLSKRSPDPWKQVCAIALTVEGDVINVGINHAGAFTEPEFFADREGRRPFMTHAEQSLVSKLRPGKRPWACVITLFPCCSCVALLAAFGFREIYYSEIYDKDLPALKVAEHYGILTHQCPLESI